MKILPIALLAAASVIAGAGSASATMSICDNVQGNLVQNCGFETGDLTGWNDVSFNGGAVSATSAEVNSGNFAADFSVTDLHQMAEIQSASFLLNAGTTYTVSFYVEQLVSNGLDYFEVDVDSPSTGRLGGMCFGYGCLAAPGSYTLESFQVTGDGAHDYLDVYLAGYGARGHGYGPAEWAVDDFEVTPVAVPEPASLILLGSGLLASGAFGFRKRKKVA